MNLVGYILFGLAVAALAQYKMFGEKPQDGEEWALFGAMTLLWPIMIPAIIISRWIKRQQDED